MRSWGPALAAVLLAGAPAASQAPEAGERAPDFRLKALDGTRIRLSDFRGQPVVLNFWATWCTPCLTEMPELVRAFQARQGRGLVVLAINLTDQERRRDVERFVGNALIPFPVLLDERGRTRERYRLIAVPTTVFIGRDGTVRRIHPGPISRPRLEDDLEHLLGPAAEGPEGAAGSRSGHAAP